MWRQFAIEGLFRLSRSEVPSRIDEYRQLEQVSSADIDEYQRRRLLALLRHAVQHVPYYRTIVASCDLDLTDGFTVDQLTKLPLLTKEQIRDVGENLFSDDRDQRGAFRNSSGGSTGKPVVFLQDRRFYDCNVVSAKFMYNEILGKAVGEPEINLWGSQRDLERQNLGAKQRLVNYLYNRRFQNYFLVDDTKLARFVDEINRSKPVSMWAYVESIDLLAKFVAANRLPVHSPRFIITTAGTLLEPMRKRIQDVFDCPVYNQYGSREFGAIAFEARDQNGLRGMPYLNYAEVVDNKVVVTCLTNFSMPLIRYDIGDTAEVWSGEQDCEYGCQRKIFSSITGRAHSHFKTAKGEIVHGLFFTHQFYFVEWVSQFQVVQERTDYIICYLVAAGEPVQADLERIRTSIRGVMGRDCNVEFQYTDRITPSASGKHLYTLSKLWQ